MGGQEALADSCAWLWSAEGYGLAGVDLRTNPRDPQSPDVGLGFRV